MGFSQSEQSENFGAACFYIAVFPNGAILFVEDGWCSLFYGNVLPVYNFSVSWFDSVLGLADCSKCSPSELLTDSKPVSICYHHGTMNIPVARTLAYSLAYLASDGINVFDCVSTTPV